MQQLWVHYSDHYQKIEFDEYSVKRMDIGPSIEHAMTVLDFPFVKGPLELKGGEDGFTVSDSQGRIGFLEVGKPVSLTQRGRQLTLSLRQAPRRPFSYFTGHVSEISFGVTDPNASINVTGGR